MSEQQIPTSEVLHRAADLIEERGWMKGDGWNSVERAARNAPLCLEGGIMAALGLRVDNEDNTSLEPLWTCPAYIAVGEYLDRDVTLVEKFSGLKSPVQSLFWWNDRSTAAEVIETLRATAVIEAAREATAHPTTTPAKSGAVA